MSKQNVHLSYPIENDSFVDFFRGNHSKIHIGRHFIPLAPIEAIHHHDAMEVGICLSGNGVFLIDSAQYSFQAPCISIIYPGQLHKARSLGTHPSQWIFLTFHPQSTDLEPFIHMLDSEGSVFSNEHLYKLIEEAIYECEQQRPHFELCVHKLLDAILIRYERDIANRSATKKSYNNNLLHNLKPVLQYITEHYQEPITVGSLSSLLYIHDTTLRTWFKKAINMSPLEYIHYTRITTACSLLQKTNIPISQIAEDVGYTTLSSFNRHFEAICGCSPRQYRQNLL